MRMRRHLALLLTLTLGDVGAQAPRDPLGSLISTTSAAPLYPDQRACLRDWGGSVPPVLEICQSQQGRFTAGPTLLRQQFERGERWTLSVDGWEGTPSVLLHQPPLPGERGHADWLARLGPGGQVRLSADARLIVQQQGNLRVQAGGGSPGSAHRGR